MWLCRLAYERNSWRLKKEAHADGDFFTVVPSRRLLAVRIERWLIDAPGAPF